MTRKYQRTIFKNMNKKICLGWLVVWLAVPGSQVVATDEPTKLSPTGRISTMPTPVSASVFWAGLLRVRVSALVALMAIGLDANCFRTVGGDTTVRVAESVLPVPPLADVTAPLVLG